MATVINWYAVASLPGGADNWPGGNTTNASIGEVRLYSGDTATFSTATLRHTWASVPMAETAGAQIINLSCEVPYGEYWWWAADFASAGNHTAVIHSVLLSMIGFSAPFQPMLSPLCGPTLVWDYEYGEAPTEPRHTWIATPGAPGLGGRSYHSFTAPIYPARDLDGDSAPDDAYVFLWRIDGRTLGTSNDSHELYITQGSLGYSRAIISEFDPATGGWFNDTLPPSLSLGVSWLFTQGMGAGIRGHRVAGGTISWWHKLDTPLNVTAGDQLTLLMPLLAPAGATSYGDVGWSPTITVDGYAADGDTLLGSSFGFNGVGTTKWNDFLLISGFTNANQVGMWDNVSALDESEWLYFTLSVGYHNGTGEGTAEPFTHWLFDNNSQFISDNPEILNRAWVNDTDDIIAFRPYAAVQVNDTYWSNTDIAALPPTASEAAEITPYIFIPDKISYTSAIIIVAATVTKHAWDTLWNKATGATDFVAATTSRKAHEQYNIIANNINWYKTHTCPGLGTVADTLGDIPLTLVDNAFRGAFAACGVIEQVVDWSGQHIAPALHTLAEWGYEYVQLNFAILEFIATITLDELQSGLYLLLELGVYFIAAADVFLMVIITIYSITLARLALWGEWERVNRLTLRVFGIIPIIGKIFVLLSVDNGRRGEA